MSEQESKLYALYQAVHLMMARLGADGEIDTRAPEVDAVMDAMHEYDGGQYIQWNRRTPQPVTPEGEPRVPWKFGGKSKPLALCPDSCGCLYVNHGDGTMSIFGHNNKPCEVCEPLPWANLMPVKFGFTSGVDGTPAADAALSDLVRVLREKHHGRMPDEVQQAFDAGVAALNQRGGGRG